MRPIDTDTVYSSELQRPRLRCVDIAYEVVNAPLRQVAQGFGCAPVLAQRELETGGISLHVREEFSVRAVVPVVGLTRGHREEPLDAGDVEIQQETAVKKQVPAFAALGVAGKFAVATRQIAVATHFGAQRVRVTLHDGRIGVVDRGVDRQDQGIVEAAGALQHSAATGATPQYRYAVPPGTWQIRFGAGFVGVTEHDEMLPGFPEPQNAIAAIGFAPVEQRLVAGEVFFGSGQRQVQQFHGA